MVDLPYDVWEVVSRHLQTAELLKLAAVHRAFYGMALDIRYGKVWWVKLDKSMVSMLSRLQYVNYFCSQPWKYSHYDTETQTSRDASGVYISEHGLLSSC
jgi:hypothetical protein